MQRTLLFLAAKKAASIATMASMLSSMLNLGLILPVKAQNYIEAEDWIGGNNYYRVYNLGQNGNIIDFGAAQVQSSDTLASLTSYINSPAPGTGNDEYTNVSYEFGLQSQIEVGAAGAYIKIATNNDLNTVGSANREQWRGLWAAENDPATIAPNAPGYQNPPPDISHNLPANIYISKVAIVNGNDTSGANTLYIKLECNMNSAPCVLDTSINNYFIDLKNNPLLKPSIIGPHRQLFIVGSYSAEDPQLGPYIESGAGKMTINSYYSGLTVSASVDARLVFKVQGSEPGTTFNGLTASVGSGPEGCDFGTLVPADPKVCIWLLAGETNAPNGMDIYVVQDGNMTYPGNGAEIKQFINADQVSPGDGFVWASPVSPVAAHLGYTSNDLSVFPLVGEFENEQVFAGISDMAGPGSSANTAENASKVADSTTAGSLSVLYVNKIETNSLLEQAPASLGQSYGHTQYFIVVGKF